MSGYKTVVEKGFLGTGTINDLKKDAFKKYT